MALENIILEIGAPDLKRRKLAIYDFDHTLVMPKQGRRFPKNAEDWTWTWPNVPEIMRKNAAEPGYLTVILTDQSKPWKVDMIRAVLEEVGVPCVAIIAMKKESKKPSPALFKSVFPTYSKSKSWMVGDAAGRYGDWSAHDRDVAAALGIPFFTPENIFIAAIAARPRLIFMIGPPGAGKSTYIAQNLEGITRIDGDVYKTSAAMIKQARQAFVAGPPGTSVVLDATHGTVKRRAAIVALNAELGLDGPPGAVWLNVDKATALARNAERGERKIPPIAIHTFYKNFEPPNPEEEGFILI